MIFFDPSRIWYLSTRLYHSQHLLLARVLKAYNFLFFRCILPPEAELSSPVRLGHYGLNVVVHPNVSIGDNVHIWHNVTIAVSDSPGSESRIILGDDIVIGSGTVIISPEKKGLLICSDVKIGANAVVSRSIKTSGTYVGIPAIRKAQ